METFLPFAFTTNPHPQVHPANIMHFFLLLPPLFLFGPPGVLSGPATRAPYYEVQPDGRPTSPLYLHGDESFSYVTDGGGYEVVKDAASGWYVYARDGVGGGEDDEDKDEDEIGSEDGGRGWRGPWSGGHRPLPGVLRVGRDNPAKGGLRRAKARALHNGNDGDEYWNERRRIAESESDFDVSLDREQVAIGAAAARARRRRRRWRRQRRRTQANGGGDDEPEILNILVVPLQFSDHEGRELIPTEDLEVFFNGDPDSDGNYHELIPTGSVRSAFLEYSYGRLKIEATVVPEWVPVSQTETYVSAGVSAYTRSVIVEALREALDTAATERDHHADDFDGVCFMHSGYAAEHGGTDCDGQDREDRIWVHSRSMSWMNPTDGDDAERNSFVYTVASAFWERCGNTMARIAMQTHEVGHILGLIDLYAARGNGVGIWDSMGYVWGTDNSQRYPPHFSAWSKILTGFVEPTVITDNGEYGALAVETSPQVYQIKYGYENNEYLLIENRQRIGYDRQLPGTGLVIYHIDNRANGQGRPGYPGQQNNNGVDWPFNGAHYQVAVLQCDGRYDLERDNNIGDGNDPWNSGTAGTFKGLGPGGKEEDGGPFPNTDSYRRGNVRSTGLLIDSFGEMVSDDGEARATFRVSGFPTPAPVSDPTLPPTPSPTTQPSIGPTDGPTRSPTGGPTPDPTSVPTSYPTIAPTSAPAASPTVSPTAVPTESPTRGPSRTPTSGPTGSPSSPSPTSDPSDAPTLFPASTGRPTSPPATEPTAEDDEEGGTTTAPTASDEDAETTTSDEDDGEAAVGETETDAAATTVSPTASPTEGIQTRSGAPEFYCPASIGGTTLIALVLWAGWEQLV